VVTVVTVMTLLAAGLAAGLLTAGGSGAAGRLTGRSGTAGRFAAGGLAAACAAAATIVVAIEEAGLSVVRETGDGASHKQHGKQNLGFHWESSKNWNRMFVFASCARLPSNPRATNLIGSNRQTLPVALTGQSGFAICQLLMPRRLYLMIPVVPDVGGGI
jgi:hypothetical protein